jgi:hypothetical protein
MGRATGASGKRETMASSARRRVCWVGRVQLRPQLEFLSPMIICELMRVRSASLSGWRYASRQSCCGRASIGGARATQSGSANAHDAGVAAASEGFARPVHVPSPWKERQEQEGAHGLCFALRVADIPGTSVASPDGRYSTADGESVVWIHDPTATAGGRARTRLRVSLFLLTSSDRCLAAVSR